MSFLTTKKGVAVLAALVVAAIAAFGAYAYFTANGTGSGSASVGNSSTIQLSGSPAAALYPGGTDAPVTVTITNPGSGAQHVDAVSGTVADNGSCLGSWFQVDSVSYGKTLAGGASDTATTAVRMLDSGTNQNVCKNKTMAIDWSSN
jgi:hypothetical protein